MDEAEENFNQTIGEGAGHQSVVSPPTIEMSPNLAVKTKSNRLELPPIKGAAPSKVLPTAGGPGNSPRVMAPGSPRAN